uniref:Ribosomal protein S2 n=1 Tax=Psammoneis japonica TaxID=517775 RepID=A0A2U9GIS5_9STRA|nr:ribosomal protein S2 [Psammoneis japonica]AWQ64264.1 ribosomal protein S2 [Psammoneis japonica]
MKIKTIKNHKYNLFKLKLIQSKVYKTKIRKLFFDKSLDVFLEDIQLHFKKVLQIIYEYHINNKRILFIGVPSFLQKKFKKILRKTNHFSIPEALWMNGILSNNKSAIFRNLNIKRLKKIKKQKHNTDDLNLLLKITKKPDLIVTFDRNLDSNAIEEMYKLRIPIISLNNALCFDFKVAYSIPENSIKANQQVSNSIFLVLSSIFKKSFGKLN